MKIKLNVAMQGYSKDQEITIKDNEGVPCDSFWRNRLADSKIDKCIEIVQTKPKRNSRSTSE